MGNISKQSGDRVPKNIEKAYEHRLNECFIKVLASHFDAPFTSDEIFEAIAQSPQASKICPFYLRTAVSNFFKSYKVAGRIKQLKTVTPSRRTGRPVRQYLTIRHGNG